MKSSPTILWFIADMMINREKHWILAVPVFWTNPARLYFGLPAGRCHSACIPHTTSRGLSVCPLGTPNRRAQRPISSHSAVISIVHGIADNSCHVPGPFCARDHTVHQMNQIRWLRNLGTWSSSCDTGPVGFIKFLCCNTTPRRNWFAAISESP